MIYNTYLGPFNLHVYLQLYKYNNSLFTEFTQICLSGMPGTNLRSTPPAGSWTADHNRAWSLKVSMALLKEYGPMFSGKSMEIHHFIHFVSFSIFHIDRPKKTTFLHCLRFCAR